VTLFELHETDPIEAQTAIQKSEIKADIRYDMGLQQNVPESVNRVASTYGKIDALDNFAGIFIFQ
jgi:hypothetical protein